MRDQLKFDIKICLVKNGYPPQYSPEVFRKVMEQVDNFKGHEQRETDDSYSETANKTDAFAGYVAKGDKTGGYKTV